MTLQCGVGVEENLKVSYKQNALGDFCEGLSKASLSQEVKVKTFFFFLRKALDRSRGLSAWRLHRWATGLLWHLMRTPEATDRRQSVKEGGKKRKEDEGKRV